VQLQVVGKKRAAAQGEDSEDHATDQVGAQQEGFGQAGKEREGADAVVRQ
jgi:hypothetical protein